MRVRLKVLTPVHIGSGETLSRMDFVLRDGKVFVLDWAKIADHFDYKTVELLLLSKNLENFFQKVRIEGFSKYSMRFSSNKTLQREIRCAIRDPLSKDLYIPGSSVKGAIVRQLLMEFLKNEKKFLEKIVRVVRNSGRKLNWSVNFTKFDKEIEGNISSYEQLMGHSIVISDFFPKRRCTGVVEKITIHLPKRNIHVYAEVIPEGTILEGEITLRKDFGKVFAEFFCEVFDIKKIPDFPKDEKELLKKVGKFQLGYGTGFKNFTIWDILDENSKRKILKILKIKVKDPGDFPVSFKEVERLRERLGLVEIYEVV